jgi:hypothetical protein
MLGFKPSNHWIGCEILKIWIYEFYMETFLEFFVKTIALLNHFIFEYFSMFLE